MLLHLTTRYGKFVVLSKLPILFCLKKKKKSNQNKNTTPQTIKTKQTSKQNGETKARRKKNYC